MKSKRLIPSSFQDLCRQLKTQLDDLGKRTPEQIERERDEARALSERQRLMEQLKKQLADLSR